MKVRFNRFAVRYLTALLLGLLLLLLHGWADGALPGIVLPKSGAPWELGKLAYWPMLAAIPVTGRLTGGMRKTASELLPAAVVTAPALFLACWGLSGLQTGWGGCLLAWVALTAAGTALSVREKPLKGGVWVLLAAALALVYVLFSLLPPVWQPFLDPHSAAAMATLPC